MKRMRVFSASERSDSTSTAMAFLSRLGSGHCARAASVLMWGGLLGIAMAGAASVAGAAPSLDIVIADDFVGGTLSKDGSTVGYTRASAEAGSGLYDVATGQRTTIINGTNGVTFPALSSDGGIVQGSYDSGFEFLYEFSGGVRTDVQNAPYAPTALSGDGSIASGNANGSAVRVTNGFNGTVDPLGDLAGGGTGSFAWDLSADGSIVIGSGSSSAGAEAFRWEGGTMVGLGDLAGGAFGSAARAISSDGSTIVGFGTAASGREAVRWTGSGIASLGNLGGAAFSSEARDVSADGSTIVGLAGLPGGQTGFVWDAVNGMREFSVVLDAAGVDLDGIEIRSVLGVSDDGRTFFGEGFQDDVFDPNSPFIEPGAGTLVWVATIPEPSTALLLMGGLAALGIRRRA